MRTVFTTMGVVVLVVAALMLQAQRPAERADQAQAALLQSAGAQTRLLWSDGARAQFIEVPSDTRAFYQLVDWSRMANGNREVITSRLGSSGVSYARREVDCANWEARYLGQGATLEKASAPSHAADMTPLAERTVSADIASFACSLSK